MVNTPWIFNTVWFFIKGLLAARTIAKVSVMGTSFIEEIGKEIPLDNLPSKYTHLCSVLFFSLLSYFCSPPFILSTCQQ